MTEGGLFHPPSALNLRSSVLLSAYACEPGKGSEPEVGWQWARQMARFHKVTVLTRANNEPAIAAALQGEGGPLSLRFIYHDLGSGWLRLKKRFGWHDGYYHLWQRSARGVIARLCRETHFDLLHHLTFAGARFPAAIAGHGVPAIWGPVGGFESMPANLLPWAHPRELGAEVLRNAANLWAEQSGSFARSAAAVCLTIASTRETAAILERAGLRHRLLPTIGLRVEDFHARESGPADRLRLLFAGRLLYWKGVELALEALHASGPNATLAFAGEGPFLPSARALTARLGLGERVQFLGQVPRAELLALYGKYDALLFPSLHDTGGFVLLEAMASMLPVICLDCAGPALAVAEGCGVRVPLGSRAEVVARLATAIRTFADDPTLRRAQGRQARAHVREHYDWDRKGEQMDAIYREVLAS
jgi:glycosyltransferase involved in cell wall biosynthesis